MKKMQMGIFTSVDKTIFDTVTILANQHQKAVDTLRIREAFDEYIDMLFNAGKITDNQHEFLELWFVWNSMENDSGA